MQPHPLNHSHRKLLLPCNERLSRRSQETDWDLLEEEDSDHPEEEDPDHLVEDPQLEDNLRPHNNWYPQQWT